MPTMYLTTHDAVYNIDTKIPDIMHDGFIQYTVICD